MKMPNEIKKGLSVCSNADAVNEFGECEGCPYFTEGQILCGINTMMEDAIAYIEQLEDKLNENEQTMSVNDEIGGMRGEAD